ncbi:efflux RND transporter permease subunit [Poriferisphaera sp. WC338]|uniref:efflux RND transporter permease subunit n=1 Tax=Poriferisphaera sp. WC338 TaxID=3425129 RepID=UPI003D81BA93
MKTPTLKPEERRGPIAWMAGNSVAANLIMVVLLIGGALFAFTANQEVFPEFELDVVNVSVAYPGASPEEVENGIVLAIEESIRGISDIKEVTSSAREGAGSVSAELITGVDAQKTYQDIKTAIDRITTFPEEAERPTVTLAERKHSVLKGVIHGPVSDKLLREIAEQVRVRLLDSPNITQVDIAWGKPLEISIEVPKDTLRAYNLTLNQVAQRIQRAAIELPSGGIKTTGGEILLRVDERKELGSEFAEIPIITTSQGSAVLLKDIAIIKDDFEDVDMVYTYEGEPAIQLNVFRVGNQSPRSVSQAFQNLMPEIQAALPPGIVIDIEEDDSIILDQRIDLLTRNAYIGLSLVFIFLGIFLEARLAFWVMLGIPISFMGAFLFLPTMDVSINMISLFAFIIALGIVVDDAIVVGESVYEYHQRGMSFKDAAIRGTREIAVPITFSILTNIVAFLPMALVPGRMGKIFRVIPIVVIIVFLISLFESLFILPAHLAHQKDARTKIGAWFHHKQQAFSHGFVHFVKSTYGPFLRFSLNNRYIVLATGIAVLAITLGYVISGRTGLVPMPRVEADAAAVTAVLPYGSPIKDTTIVRDRIAAAAERVAEKHGGGILLENLAAGIGGSAHKTSGPHVAEVVAYLSDPDTRPISTSQFIKEWRKETGAIPGLESLTFEFDRMGPGSGQSLTIELSHADNEVLRAACADLANALQQFPNVSDINDGFLPGKKQLSFTMRPEGRALGLTAADVAVQVRSSFYGAEALRQQRDRNEIKIMVRLPKEERIFENQLNQLLLRSPEGTEIPLYEAVNVDIGRAYTTIDRRNGRRVVNVTANVTPDRETPVILDSVKASIMPNVLTKYPNLSYSFEGKAAELSDSMTALALGFVLATFGIYALLAIPFRSYIQPAIIMTAIPFGIVGAIIGHIIMGYAISIISMMGIVALTGVVVNDSLVLIDYANRLYRSGTPAHDAIQLAGIRRFRPIMLTTITTFGGLAPMIFETSIQAKFLIPMAISLGFGILFATFISLMLVPCLYLIIEDIKSLVLGTPIEIAIDRSKKAEEVLAE